MEKYLIKQKTGAPSNKRLEVTANDPGADGGPKEEEETDQDLDHSKAEKKKQKVSSFTLREVKGDLFAAPEKESLAHCISEDVRMGKGIATIFKEKFGGVKDLLSQGVKPGGVAVLERGSRFVYYLVTKEKYWNKPTYDSLRCSLESMAKHCQSHGVRALSMPRIGCGLDGLKWSTVKQIISETFKDTDIVVTVYTL